MSPESEDAVRQALDAAGIPAEMLAREAGVSPALVRMIRLGKRSATPSVVRAIADAFERMGERHMDAARILRNLPDAERNQ